MSVDGGDEGEGDCTDEEMDARDLTPEEGAAATPVLDAPDDDQEGLTLTGGDWFNTIKQVAKTNKEAEKELAARMKKAKISQTSLENEVFEGLQTPWQPPIWQRHSRWIHAKNRLNFYAPLLVETMTRMASRVGPGVNVIPLLPVPVAGISSETLVRDMMDLDSWFVSTGAGQAAGLPDSRDTFWRVALEAGRGGRRVYTSSAPLSLPGGLKNPRIRPFVSGAYAGTIPAEILPLKPKEERAIVETLLTELNEKFCVSLDQNPSLDRSIPPSPTAHNAGRTVFIGGSNPGRISKAAAKNCHMIVDLTVKGWICKSGKIGKLCETLKKLNLTEIDTVVIDSMSNTAFLGIVEDGLPIPAEKS
jgi:hypothetical protein